MTTENKAIVKEFIDRLFTEGDVSVLDELAAPDYVDHDPPFGGTGTVDGWRAMTAMIRDAFPDWHSELYALYVEGDIVVERFTAPIPCRRWTWRHGATGPGAARGSAR